MTMRDAVKSTSVAELLFRVMGPGWVTSATLRLGSVMMLLVLTGALTVFQANSAQAQGQFIPCVAPSLPLVKIPELVAENGELRKTIMLTDVTQRSNLTSDPANTNCRAQFVRNFVGVNATLPYYLGAAPRSGYTPPARPSEFYSDPVPGPTLRARVGDLIQLTFLNQVDAAHYPDTIDAGDSVGACDESSGSPGYPQKAHEIFPNCFHGSSSANIHFHGTHTNPSSTGDNVFLNIGPSPRLPPLNGQPTVTSKMADDWLNGFFDACERNLKENVLSQWPYLWEDLPSTYRQAQEQLIRAYDNNRPDPEKLWPVDEYQIATRQWPQYYIGAYPYCFRLPDFTAGTWPPPRRPAPGGQANRALPTLQMGQAPGIHWYHAHKHGSTTINVLNGMTGAFIIEGSYDDDLNRSFGTIEVPNPGGAQGSSLKVPWTRAQPVLVLNELGVSPTLLGGGSGPNIPFSVNGRMQPVLTMRPNEVQLWRIVNTSSRTFANIVGPPSGFEWRQLAQDGVQFSQSNYDRSARATSFLLAAGNRVDLLVKAPGTASANLVPVEIQRTVTRTGLSDMPKVTLMSVQVTGDTPSNRKQTEFIAKAPVPPPFLADIKDSEIAGTKNITFNSGPSLSAMQHTVDGKQFDGSTGAEVLLGRAEEWKIMNTTAGNTGPIDHPFHIHINPFQIVEVFDPNESLLDAKTGQRLMDPESGSPLVDAATNKPLLDEHTGKTIMDPKTLTPFPKYVFDEKAKKVDGQCVINPQSKPQDWKPCGNVSGAQPNLIWWDTFPIPSGKIATDANGNVLKDAKGEPIVVPGYFKMRSRFVDYPGLFVLHCHILAHEDRGMMTVVEVRPLFPPVQHH
jgi:FtsP/CotA-like multicopper oxidase with cupredoxin domain